MKIFLYTSCVERWYFNIYCKQISVIFQDGLQWGFFSEIFRVNVSHDLSSTQKSKIVTKYIQSSYCNDYVRTVRVNNEIFVHYVSLQQFCISSNSIHDWPNYIMTENLPRSLLCTRCGKLCNVTSSVVEKADFSFTELDVESAMVVPFSKLTNLEREAYNLAVLVRHTSSHFACVIAANLLTQGIIYFNDLQDESIIFSSFQLLCQHTEEAVFLGYIQYHIFLGTMTLQYRAFPVF